MCSVGPRPEPVPADPCHKYDAGARHASVHGMPGHRVGAPMWHNQASTGRRGTPVKPREGSLADRTARRRGTVVLAAVALVLACRPVASAPESPQPVSDPMAVPDAVPREEPRSPYGNPEFYEVDGRRYRPLSSSDGFVERGTASWYGAEFHGRRTSSGEAFDMYAMTAAHPTLPLPTYVEVTNLENGRRVVVRVNDRGPFKDGRIIDLSYVAAYRLGMIQNGTARVEVRALAPESTPR